MWDIRISNEIHYGGMCLWIAKEGSAPGTIDYVESIVLRSVPEGHYPEPRLEPVLPTVGKTTEQFMQAMLDAAWAAGFRPTRAQSEADKERHLQDMRLIAFHQLNIEDTRK